MSLASPTMAVVGGLPTLILDVPVCAAFLAIYSTGCILNASIFFSNRRRGHKFFISWILNAFCLVRIVTCSMRIAWATDATNRNLVIAAQVFNNAGILIIYIVNLVFAQRILRSRQPSVGWNPILDKAVTAFFVLMAAALIMGIVVLGISVNTTNPTTLQSIRYVTLTSVTFLLVVTVLPLFLLAPAYLLPTSGDLDPFGSGKLSTRAFITLFSTCLCIAIAGFKTGTTWAPARPVTNPAWYHSKAAFYCFTFTLEVIILSLFLISRVDKRFYIPANCTGPGDYSRCLDQSEEMRASKDKSKRISNTSTFHSNVI